MRPWRRALTGTVWRTGRLRIAGPAIVAFEPEGYDELDPDDVRVHLRLLSTAIEGEIAVRETRTGRVEVVQMWGRPESARREFRRLRAQ